VCPAGNDYTHTSEPDIASCCATCSASVQAFQGKYGANASPDGIVCLAWTYNPANKLCFLKNSKKFLRSKWNEIKIKIPSSVTHKLQFPDAETQKLPFERPACYHTIYSSSKLP
jgi:hypothetical protein